MQTLTAIIYQEDGIYVAECPEVGTASQGKTIDDAINNLKEATDLYLEEFTFSGKKHPLITTFETSYA